MLGWCRHPFMMTELIGVHVLAQGHLNRTNANLFMETLWLVQRSIVLPFGWETFTLTNRHSESHFILHWTSFSNNGFTFPVCFVFITLAIKTILLYIYSLGFASLIPRSDEWALGSTSPQHPPEPGTATMGTQQALVAPSTWHTGHTYI